MRARVRVMDSEKPVKAALSGAIIVFDNARGYRCEYGGVDKGC